MNRKARDRAIAAEIVDELTKALGGPVAPQTLAEHPDVVERIFERVFDEHQIVNEFAGANILKCVPRILAKNFAIRSAAAASPGPAPSDAVAAVGYSCQPPRF